MAAFRVKFVDPDGTWWTGPIDSWADVNMLLVAQRRVGLSADAFVNSRALNELFTRLLAEAVVEQNNGGRQAVGMLTWGSPCGRSATTIVRVSTSAAAAATQALVPVVGGWPLLDAAPQGPEPLAPRPTIPLPAVTARRVLDASPQPPATSPALWRAILAFILHPTAFLLRLARRAPRGMVDAEELAR